MMYLAIPGHLLSFLSFFFNYKQCYNQTNIAHLCDYVCRVNSWNWYCCVMNMCIITLSRYCCPEICLLISCVKEILLQFFIKLPYFICLFIYVPPWFREGLKCLAGKYKLEVDRKGKWKGKMKT